MLFLDFFDWRRLENDGLFNRIVIGKILEPHIFVLPVNGIHVPRHQNLGEIQIDSRVRVTIVRKPVDDEIGLGFFNLTSVVIHGPESHFVVLGVSGSVLAQFVLVEVKHSGPVGNLLGGGTVRSSN